MSTTSGAAKLKKRKIKDDDFQKVLKKNTKIESFFNKNPISEKVLENRTVNQLFII